MAGRPKTRFSDLAKQYVQQKRQSGNALLKVIDQKNEDSKLFPEYMYDPCGYARNVLNVAWWYKQRLAANALIEKKKVLVRSSHLVGKSFMGGGLINWAFDCYMPLSGVVTAPTDALVRDVVFSEARKQRRTHNAWRGSSSPVLQDLPDHVVRGVTVNDPTSMHGRHSPNVFLMIDEATGVDASIFEAMESLYEGDNAYWICFYNPTNTGAYVHYLESVSSWHVIRISALEHPNIIYQANNPGDPRVPIPGAITLDRLKDLIKQWSTPIESNMAKVTDILLPGTSNEWYRPGPICEGRLLARWPSQSYQNIWTDSLFDEITELDIPINYEEQLIEFSCDPARFGDDFTAIMAKCGENVLFAQEYNGLSNVSVANLLIQLMHEYSNFQNSDPKNIPVRIDEIGVGSGVIDILDDLDYNVVPINVSNRAIDSDKYPNIRSELWFNTVKSAENRKISLKHLDSEVSLKLKRELLAPIYRLDNKGRQLVESKVELKRRTKMPSPNLADAFNLLFYDASEIGGITVTVKI